MGEEKKHRKTIEGYDTNLGIIQGQKGVLGRGVWERRCFRGGGFKKGVFRGGGAEGRGKAQKNLWSKSVTPTWV